MSVVLRMPQLPKSTPPPSSATHKCRPDATRSCYVFNTPPPARSHFLLSIHFFCANSAELTLRSKSLFESSVYSYRRLHLSPHSKRTLKHIFKKNIHVKQNRFSLGLCSTFLHRLITGGKSETRMTASVLK